VGSKLRGIVTVLSPIGAFVEVADGIQGLIPVRTPAETPAEVGHIGAEVAVVVTGIDRERRQVTLSLS
jgi:small subunit ribosomal protein S1